MNYETITDLAEQIQASPLGTLLSESPLAFPIVEGLHLISLAVSVGLLFLIDLRLLGLLWRDVPLQEVLSELRHYVLAGFALVFLTGVLLFWAEAPTLVASPAFPFKLLFILLAGLNALYFELAIARSLDQHDASPVPPRPVRLAGAASLVLWTLVVICGRLIPYLPTWS